MKKTNQATKQERSEHAEGRLGQSKGKFGQINRGDNQVGSD